MANLKHQYKVKITKKYLDAFDHVNNAAYLILYEEARWDLITQNNYGLQRIRKINQGPVLLDLHLTFRKEIIGGEEILIESQFSGMKNRKILTMKQKMLKDDGITASTILLTCGLMDFKTRKLITPTEEFKRALLAR